MTKKILTIFSVLFISWGLLSAQESKFVEGMNHSDFAKLLVKEANLEMRLPAAPEEEDFFKLLMDLGVQPVQGWDKGGNITRQDLLYILGYNEEEAGGIDFSELCQEVVSLLKEMSSFNNTEESLYPFEEQ
ncbi:MAG: hypothetical protein NC821_02355 [Candidatus Omnitrophica bacterium]|nr:hypothetical protein [Candidatus Omnitrophota bacterium]